MVEIGNGKKQREKLKDSQELLTYLSVVGYSSLFTRQTISKAIVMPSLPSVATVILSHGISVHSKTNPGEACFAVPLERF